MKRRSIKQTLGLHSATGLLTDRLFWAAVFAGVLVSALLSTRKPGGTAPGFDTDVLISLLLWYPLIEELAFRGVLQGTLAETTTGTKKWLGLSVANLISTLAFVLWHSFYQLTPIIVSLAFPSLVFGFFRDRYQSLWPAVMLHCLYNSFFLTAQWLFDWSH